MIRQEDRGMRFGKNNDYAVKMKGSALIMDFESRKELDEYIANEPYVVYKVWEKIEIENINVVIANTKK